MVSAQRGGSAYVAEYLERMGDLWSGVLAPLVRCGGRVMVAGPEGVADGTLADLGEQSGGFGVDGGLTAFLEERVRDYLAADRARFAVLELWEESGPFAFPVFRFRPSLMATWDGGVRREWVEGFCGFVSVADGDAVLREALAECAWWQGVVALLPLAERDVERLRGDDPVGLAESERLAAQVEAVFVPAHDREALAVWVNTAE